MDLKIISELAEISNTEAFRPMIGDWIAPADQDGRPDKSQAVLVTQIMVEDEIDMLATSEALHPPTWYPTRTVADDILQRRKFWFKTDSTTRHS